MAAKNVIVNRAPVLTLWAAVVAERLGYDHESALTLGRAVASLNAQSKGRRLGIFEEPEEKRQEKIARARQAAEEFRTTVLNRRISMMKTKQGVRATLNGKPINPESVNRYLENKFGNELPEVQAAMEELAQAYEPDQLAAQAYSLYEQFRPEIPGDKRGWGAEGKLDLDQIRSLAAKES